MNLFRSKPHSVCAECRVHFEPQAGVRHPELCPTHRKPVVELEDRILLVCEWAKANWEELEPKAKEQLAKRNATHASMLQGLGNSAMSQQQNAAAQANNPYAGTFGGLGGLIK